MRRSRDVTSFDILYCLLGDDPLIIFIYVASRIALLHDRFINLFIFILSIIFFKFTSFTYFYNF